MTQSNEQSLQALKALDTPTVCNAIEAVYPNRRNRKKKNRPFTCSRPSLPSIVGYARTARLRAMHQPTDAWNRDSYYSYVAEGGPVPSISVIQDLDEMPGYGSFWGEVNSNLHYGLDCLGVITNGCVRDIPDAQDKFQMLAGMVNPSHAWVHLVDWGQSVTVHGMDIEDGDLIHADMHGAVVVPQDGIQEIVEMAQKIFDKERILINASQQPGFNMEKLREAWKNMAEFH